MENLSRTIETIFLRQNPEDIIQGLYRMEGIDWLSGPSDSSYVDIAETIDFSHNRDELKNIDSKSRIVWFHPVGERQLSGRNGNIFYSLPSSSLYNSVNIAERSSHGVHIRK